MTSFAASPAPITKQRGDSQEVAQVGVTTGETETCERRFLMVRASQPNVPIFLPSLNARNAEADTYKYSYQSMIVPEIGIVFFNSTWSVPWEERMRFGSHTFNQTDPGEYGSFLFSKSNRSGIDYRDESCFVAFTDDEVAIILDSIVPSLPIDKTDVKVWEARFPLLDMPWKGPIYERANNTTSTRSFISPRIDGLLVSNTSDRQAAGFILHSGLVEPKPDVWTRTHFRHTEITVKVIPRRLWTKRNSTHLMHVNHDLSHEPTTHSKCWGIVKVTVAVCERQRVANKNDFQ